MMSETIWFGLITLGLPALLDWSLLQLRYWLKYRSHQPVRKTHEVLNAYFEALNEFERLQALTERSK